MMSLINFASCRKKVFIGMSTWIIGENPMRKILPAKTKYST